MKRINRLLSNDDFKETINKHNRLINKSFTIYYAKNNLDRVRIGVSVSKKIGIAVLRNKYKRQVRMMCQDNIAINYSYDVVVIINQDYKNYDYSKNFQNFKELICKIK